VAARKGCFFHTMPPALAPPHGACVRPHCSLRRWCTAAQAAPTTACHAPLSVRSLAPPCYNRLRLCVLCRPHAGLPGAARRALWRALWVCVWLPPPLHEPAHAVGQRVGSSLLWLLPHEWRPAAAHGARASRLQRMHSAQHQLQHRWWPRRGHAPPAPPLVTACAMRGRVVTHVADVPCTQQLAGSCSSRVKTGAADVSTTAQPRRIRTRLSRHSRAAHSPALPAPLSCRQTTAPPHTGGVLCMIAAP
jgi:hypothetical protein